MTTSGLVYVLSSLLYVFALAIFALRAQLYSKNKYNWIILILMWLVPLAYWFQITYLLGRSLKLYASVSLILCVIFPLLCFSMISGLLGVHNHLSLTIAAVMWFMLPASITFAFIFARIRNH